MILDDTDPGRAVTWMEVDDPERDAPTMIARLDAFTRAHGRNPSDSEGVILTVPDDRTPGAPWRLAVGVEVGAPLASVVEEGLHLKAWPGTRVLGVFHLPYRKVIDEVYTVLHPSVAPAMRYLRTSWTAAQHMDRLRGLTRELRGLNISTKVSSSHRAKPTGRAL